MNFFVSFYVHTHTDIHKKNGINIKDIHRVLYIYITTRLFYSKCTFQEKTCMKLLLKYFNYNGKNIQSI